MLRHLITWILFAALTLTFSLSIKQATASTATMVVSQKRLGVTPQYIGYNIGHYLPDSNTLAWIEYSGVNAFRVWMGPGDYESNDDITPSGDSILDLASFNASKASLRKNPRNPKFINFAKLDERFKNDVQKSRNKVVAHTAFTDLLARDITPIVELSFFKSWPHDSWAGKWEQWQRVYALVYYMGGRYGVWRYQTCNEPDQKSNPVPLPEFLERFRVSSDAIRCAIEDVNRDFKKNLIPDISAPVTINGATKFDPWGKATLETNRTDYMGNKTAYDLFNTFDVHRYGSSGAAFIKDMQTFKTEIPKYNPSGKMMPVTYTEFNRRNSSSFAKSTDTLDTPKMYLGLADDYLGAMQEGVTGMYAFKFSQTYWDHDHDNKTPEERQKTGFHFVKDDFKKGGKNDVIGATKGAGVVRLAAKALKGARPNLDIGLAASNKNYGAAGSFDSSSHNYYLFCLNENGKTGYDLKIDFTGWDVQRGSVISVEEVSPDHHGEVTRLVPLTESKEITLTQPPQSVWLITVPQGLPRRRVLLAASDDASVRNGTKTAGYDSKNYGGAKVAYVGRSPDSSRYDYATYVKFNLREARAADISQASFHISGKSIAADESKPEPILFHVYALMDDGWDEEKLTWKNAPNLAKDDPRIERVGSTAYPVGHLTFNKTSAETGVDLTDFIRLHPEIVEDGTLTLALVREERFPSDADPISSYVELATKESETAPRLELFLAPELPSQSAGGR